MRIQFKQSVKEKIDNVIDGNYAEVEYIELSTYEYIQFLEEISDVQRILIIDPTTKLRTYRNTRLKVLT